MIYKTYDEWFNAQLSLHGNWAWNETGVDAYLIDKESNEEVQVQRLVEFCSQIGFPHLKEGNVRELFERGIKTPEEVIQLGLAQFTIILGANGVKIYNGIKETLTNIPLYQVMGSHPAFGRGIGQRKIKSLIGELGEDFDSWTFNKIVNVEGFDTKTANLVLEGLPAFTKFWINTKNDIIYKDKDAPTGIKLRGEKVVMTGFRDKDMEKAINELGGEVQSSVQKTTTILVALDPNSSSGKASKAREMTAQGKANIKVMGVDEFWEYIS